MNKDRIFKQICKPYQQGGLIGIPFIDGGRGRTGCDCWGLVLLGFEMFGIEIPDYNVACSAVKQSDFAPAKIGEEVESYRFQWKEIKKPYPPVLVPMATAQEAPHALNHLGVYIGKGMFLHTLKKRNSSVDKLTHPFFKNAIEGYYEFIRS